MVSINKSFTYGICFASVTWAICLILYFQINPQTKLKKWLWSGNGLYPNTCNNSYFWNGSCQVAKIIPWEQVNDEEADLKELGMVLDAKDHDIRDEGYKLHAYNVLISNRLIYNRKVPDTRNKLCKNLPYPEPLPTASIIICFYNEHYHTLLRSLHSVLNRSPIHLLSEIILVDDYSDLKDLHEDVNKYIEENFNKVKLVRTEKREGLIRARMFGARKAVGDVLVFLDSHIEVNVNWLEPLLARVKENRHNVVTPIIDIINADTFAYTPSPLVRGGFNWGLHFKWENLPLGTLEKDEDFVKPIKSPTMAGGLFAIDRHYFTELGEYDEGMDIWGGENIEMSFRIWMCGGNLELIPCSRVGHVFRKRRPYTAPDGKDTMLYNSLRVAHVWMDDYKEYFIKNQKAGNENYGDVSSRIELRKKLKCHDFDWYIKNVYPELILPSDDETRLKKKWAALQQDQFQPWHSRKRNYVSSFQLRLSNSSLCVQSQKDTKTKGSKLLLKPCIRSKNQIWYETDKSEFVLAQLLCLQANTDFPVLYKCHEMAGDQEWNHKGESKTPIYNLATGTCLGVNKKSVDSALIMKLCTDSKLSTWDFVKTAP